jgi:hypothetical protein
MFSILKRKFFHAASFCIFCCLIGASDEKMRCSPRIPTDFKKDVEVDEVSLSLLDMG